MVIVGFVWVDREIDFLGAVVTYPRPLFKEARSNPRVPSGIPGFHIHHFPWPPHPWTSTSICLFQWPTSPWVGWLEFHFRICPLPWLNLLAGWLLGWRAAQTPARSYSRSAVMNILKHVRLFVLILLASNWNPSSTMFRMTLIDKWYVHGGISDLVNEFFA